MNTPPPTPDSDWQRIWFAVLKHEWNSIAIIPSHQGVDVTKVAEMLAATCRIQGERVVTIVSAVGFHLAEVGRVIDSVAAAAGRGELVLVPVDALSENPSSIGVVRATSATLLVVRLGESDLSLTRAVIELVGRERVVGSVVLDEGNRQEREPS